MPLKLQPLRTKSSWMVMLLGRIKQALQISGKYKFSPIYQDRLLSTKRAYKNEEEEIVLQDLEHSWLMYRGNSEVLVKCSSIVGGFILKYKLLPL